MTVPEPYYTSLSFYSPLSLSSVDGWITSERFSHQEQKPLQKLHLALIKGSKAIFLLPSCLSQAEVRDRPSEQVQDTFWWSVESCLKRAAALMLLALLLASPC